jgi:5-methylcytosine-specific restriction protein B
VKPGDKIIGYETTPVQKVTSVLEVTHGLHEPDGGNECISFKVVEQLAEPRSLQDLRKQPALANCGPLLGNHLGNLFQITKADYEAILAKGPLRLVDLPDEPELEEFSIKEALEKVFVGEADFRGWLKQWALGKNLILQGPPGVGKTFVARTLAYALMQVKDPRRVAMVQFHQSYGYEEFVQGYRPGTKNFELRNGTFYDFCIKAKESPKDQPFVFVIDEINRGNMSRIFGELLMLTEPDKRGEGHALRLAYQGEGQSFFVPENVYLLGLMNTADRSLAVVDYALRRRFRFATLQPAFNSTAFREHLADSCDDDLAQQIILRVGRLNEAIAKDVANLGPGFCIGHSYFCQITSILDYREVIHYQIAPLLREYWFDAPKKAEDWIEDLLGL